MSQRTKQQVKLQDSKTLTRHWDAFGRPVGYSVDGDRKQSITYDPATGRIAESDDIGNRTVAEGKTYTANNLNQYTAIDDFAPEYDADGNQTLIKTETGIWSVVYNAENRPIRWQSGDIVITMAFDRMGRRVDYQETRAGQVVTHFRFVYDNFLCVQRLNADNGNAVRSEFVWDPTEPIATRPLVMRAKNWATSPRTTTTPPLAPSPALPAPPASPTATSSPKTPSASPRKSTTPPLASSITTTAIITRKMGDGAVSIL